MLFVAVTALLSGALILRRRGVYFSLLTLALTALLFAIGYRWTEFTGGESGLGGVTRSTVLGIDLGTRLDLLRAGRRAWPGGRATCSGASTARRSAACWWRSARTSSAPASSAIRPTATSSSPSCCPRPSSRSPATLSVFNHRFASAEPLSVAFSGELIAMVVIGGMRSFLGPGARRAVLHPVPRVPVDLDAALAVLVRPAVRRLHRVLADRPGRRRRAADRAVPPTRGRGRGHGRPHRRREGAALPQVYRRPAGERSAGAGRRRTWSSASAASTRSTASTLAVKDRTLHALIGPNGAGKTTAFNLVSGLYPPDRGTIELDGRSIAGLKPEDITAAGVGRSFQITNLFGGLSVEENLRLAVQARHRQRFAVWRSTDALADVTAETAELIDLPRAHRHRARRGGLAVLWRPAPARHGRWRSPPRPRILLLDEPLAGLAAAERERIAALVKAVSPRSRCCWSSTTSTACSRSPTTSP